MTEDTRAGWLKNLQKEGTTVQTLEVDGATYSYTVVDFSKIPSTGLPYVVGGPEKTPLLISDNVAKEFRPYILGHEIRHTTLPKTIPPEEHCTRAIEMELAGILHDLPDRYKEYVTLRQGFFTAMAQYVNRDDQKAAYPNELRESITRGRDFLDEVAKDLDASKKRFTEVNAGKIKGWVERT